MDVNHLATLFLIGVFCAPIASAHERADDLARKFDNALVVASLIEEAMPLADQLAQLGLDTGNFETRVRGMTRQMFAEAHFGRWASNTLIDDIESLLPRISNESLAFAEYRMFHGFFLGMYLHRHDEAIRSLNKAMSIASAHQNDEILAKSYYFLSVIESQSGKGQLAEDYLYRSILLFRKVQDPYYEYVARVRILDQQLLSYRKSKVADSDVSRLAELANQIEIESPYALTTADRNQHFEQVVSDYHFVPGTRNTNSIAKSKVSQSAVMVLLSQSYRDREWDRVEELVPLAMEIALHLQDPTSVSQTYVFRALLYVHRGQIDKANEEMKHAVDYHKGRKSFNFLAESYFELGKEATDSGYNDAAASYFAKGERHLERASAGYALENAKSIVDDIFYSRQLNNNLRRQENAIQRQWSIFVGGLVALSILFLLQKIRQSKRLRTELQEQIETQTESLRISKEQAERANQAKTDFLAHLNHEIRNPLAALIGSCELLELNLGQTVNQDVSTTIRACSENLLDVVEDVLDFTRIESGQLELNENDFKLRDIFLAVESITSRRLNEGVELHVNYDDNTPDELLGDESKLRQVLLNLGLNAAKHTNAGTINFHCVWAATDADSGVMQITVQDTGFGISADRLPTVFSPYRTDVSRPGTGLGLYISKAFIDLMGGEIEINSELGVGTTVTVKVPLVLSQVVDQPIVLKSNNFQSYVLVVDDEAINRQVLMNLLVAHEYPTLVAQNGREAIEMVRQHKISTVFLDLRMPEMDGFQVISQMRGLAIETQPRIFALTGDATKPIRQRAERAGFDGFVSKPYRTTSLIKLIEEANELQRSVA